jgi:CMP-N-acetylneuraminic acid synthetase
MINDKKILAIIPARGGSKRLPKKNILDIAGKPLISWSINAAKKSLYIDDIIVSTDCEDIARVSEEYGATVPFLRPENISTDMSSTNDVILHAINAYKQGEFDYYIILQPTSPMRNSIDIDESIRQIFESNLDGVVSVCECEHSPLWCNTLPQNKELGSFLPEGIKNLRSQDLDTYYRLNGAVYLYKNDSRFQYEGIFYSDKVQALIMPTERSIDIDNIFDFKVAKALLEEIF